MRRDDAYKVFEALNPSQAAILACSEGILDGLEKIITDLNEENIRDVRGKSPKYLHSQYGALQEARQWVSNELQDIDERVEIVIIYGVGAGWYWKALLPWVERKQERRLIFIEDDLALIGNLLESDLGCDMITHLQTTLIHIQNERDNEALDLIVWTTFRRKWKWIVSPLYQKNRPKASQLVQNAFHVRQSDVHLVADEFSTFGVTHLRNLLRNLTFMKDAKNGLELSQAFHGIPIVVVAAGPSLEKSLSFLQKWKEKVIIISGGSATNALLEAGIIPHFAASVDPNPMQYSRLKYFEPFRLPMFFRSRALYEALQSSGAFPLLYLQGGDGYPFIRFCEESMGIHGPEIDGGDSVACLLIELAVFLGASDIIMIGYDLGYLDNLVYSPTMQHILHTTESLHYSANNLKEKGREEDSSNSGNKSTRPIHEIEKHAAADAPAAAASMPASSIFVLANDGKSHIATEAKWVIEAQWIAQFANSVQDSVTCINTSLKGYKIEGIDCLSFEEIEKRASFSRTEKYPFHNIAAKVAKEIHSVPFLHEKASDETIGHIIKMASQAIEQIQFAITQFQERVQQIQLQDVLHDSLCVQYLADIENSRAMSLLFSPFWQMHIKWMATRLKVDHPLYCDFQLVETQHIVGKLFEAKALLDRVQFIRDAASAYEKIFFSFVSWAIVQANTFFSDPYIAAPWPEKSKMMQVPSLL